MSVPFTSRSSRVGSGIALAIPDEASDGPTERTNTLVLPPFPKMMNPPMMTSLSGPTAPRVLILARVELDVEFKSYTSTRAVPVPPFFPLATAV